MRAKITPASNGQAQINAASHLVVFAAKKEMEILSDTNLGGPIYSTPAAANGVLYVHSNTHLFAFHDSEHKRMASDEKPKGQLELAKPDANK